MGFYLQEKFSKPHNPIMLAQARDKLYLEFSSRKDLGDTGWMERTGVERHWKHEQRDFSKVELLWALDYITFLSNPLNKTCQWLIIIKNRNCLINKVYLSNTF